MAHFYSGHEAVECVCILYFSVALTCIDFGRCGQTCIQQLLSIIDIDHSIEWQRITDHLSLHAFMLSMLFLSREQKQASVDEIIRKKRIARVYASVRTIKNPQIARVCIVKRVKHWSKSK